MKITAIAIICYLLLFEGCRGCSKSGRIFQVAEQRGTTVTGHNQLTTQQADHENNNQQLPSAGNIIKMREENGVYLVPVEINGVWMEFIFDTGASDITISATEALFLYKQGKLSDDDIKGTRQYVIADGTIAEGTVIILRKVKIGSRVLENVEASIVNSLEAPLLIGQSALSRFGKITIDYDRQEIVFD